MAAAREGGSGGGSGGGRREEEKTVALCGAGNLASTRCEEGSGLCVKHPFQVTPLDWVFPHWSPRNVTSRHNDCLTKRAVGERAVGKQAVNTLYCALCTIVRPPQVRVLLQLWTDSARCRAEAVCARPR